MFFPVMWPQGLGLCASRTCSRFHSWAGALVLHTFLTSTLAFPLAPSGPVSPPLRLWGRKLLFWQLQGCPQGVKAEPASPPPVLAFPVGPGCHARPDPSPCCTCCRWDRRGNLGSRRAEMGAEDASVHQGGSPPLRLCPPGCHSVVPAPPVTTVWLPSSDLPLPSVRVSGQFLMST